MLFFPVSAFGDELRSGEVVDIRKLSVFQGCIRSRSWRSCMIVAEDGPKTEM